MSFKNDLEDEGPLQKSLAKTLPKSMKKITKRIEKYAKAEKDTPGTKTTKQEKKNDLPKRDRDNTGFNRQETTLRVAQAVTTVFKISVNKVVERIRNQTYYKAPEKIPGEFMRRSLGKHYVYNNEDGHFTQGQRALKTQWEDLVRQGHRRELINEAKTREQ